MKHSQILYSLTLILFSYMALGQEIASIDFIETEHDFGEIKEENGPAIFEFEFENKGETPIIISGVKASCGCTTPGWSKEPVLPGEKGFVKAQYNPRNRPGSFRKTLTVTTNVGSGKSYLYIKGKVIPRIKTKEELFPYLIGNLRLNKKVFNLSKITTEKPVEKSFEIYNAGTDSILFLDKYEGPDFIKVSFVPNKLAPASVGNMKIWYDPIHDDNLGMNDHGISFFTAEAENGKKDVSIRATISEYFPPLSAAELEKAPKLQIEERMKDLGIVPMNGTKMETFVINNAGKSKLNIRKVDSNCTCLVASLDNENIKPGGSATLTVTFNAENRRGRQTKSITLFSNDPNDPTQMVTVKSLVSGK